MTLRRSYSGRIIVFVTAVLATACVRIGPAPAPKGSAPVTAMPRAEEVRLPANGPGSNSSVENPAVFLDHVYIALDSVTYHEIVTSRELRDFAGVATSTVNANKGESWTGTYIRGRTTYIELFGPKGFDGPPGASGMGLSVTLTGSSEPLRARLQAAVGDTAAIFLRTRLAAGKEEPWFFAVGVGRDTMPALFHWVMEYYPEILRRQGADSVREDGLRIRKRVAMRGFDSTRVLEGIIGVTVAMPAEERERFYKEAEVYGWSIGRIGESYVATAPNFTITVIPQTSGVRGIQSLRLRLMRMWNGPAVLRFGSRSTLRFLDASNAEWKF